MGVLETILIIIEALVSVALIVVVLLQSGKEAGLSGALTGASESYMNKNKKGNLDAGFLHQVDCHRLDRADAGSEPDSQPGLIAV